jgi:thiamine pyrophosphate-dependent acetolactate synthase large subunit-like protein
MTKVGYLGRRLFPIEKPGKFIFPRGYGTLGFSPPAAFGAATASDERDVVAVVGDGGAMFTIQDLATAVKYDLSAPILICNDESYGVIGAHQQDEYGRTTADQIANPDFVALAKSCGATGTRIPTETVVDKLPQTLEAAWERDGPTVIDIPFSNSSLTLKTTTAMRTLNSLN